MKSAKYFLTRADLNDLRLHFESDEQYQDYLTAQGIEAYESREAFDLRMDLQIRLNAQSWTANNKNTGLTWEKRT